MNEVFQVALFFDQNWFDERLKAFGLSHEDLAAEMGLALPDLAAIWKDQRELSEEDVVVMADVLLAEPEVIANRAGISTPTPAKPVRQDAASLEARIAQLEARVAELERRLEEKQKP